MSFNSVQCNELHSFKSVKENIWFCFIYQNINSDAFNSCVMAVKEITKGKFMTFTRTVTHGLRNAGNIVMYILCYSNLHILIISTFSSKYAELCMCCYNSMMMAPQCPHM